MKERFSADEWEKLEMASIHACIMAAICVSKPTEGINRLLMKIETSEITYKDPLHEELAQSIAGSEPIPLVEKAKELEISALETIRDFLRQKLKSEEYQSFVRSLFIDQWNFAMACDNDINKKGRKSLYSFALFWGINLEALPVSAFDVLPKWDAAKWLAGTAQQIRTFETLEKLAREEKESK